MLLFTPAYCLNGTDINCFLAIAGLAFFGAYDVRFFIAAQFKHRTLCKFHSRPLGSSWQFSPFSIIVSISPSQAERNAKQPGCTSSLEPLIARLHFQGGYFISDEI
jgi:hypothetical protein